MEEDDKLREELKQITPPNSFALKTEPLERFLPMVKCFVSPVVVARDCTFVKSAGLRVRGIANR